MYSCVYHTYFRSTSKYLLQGGDIIDNLFLIFTILICICTLFCTAVLTYVTKKLTKLPSLASTADVRVDGRNLTSYEMERLEREEEFDERITRLKQEMSAQSRVIHRSTTADELHPLVHNLPHNIIQTTHDNLPDVEISY